MASIRKEDFSGPAAATIIPRLIYTTYYSIDLAEGSTPENLTFEIEVLHEKANSRGRSEESL